MKCIGTDWHTRLLTRRQLSGHWKISSNLLKRVTGYLIRIKKRGQMAPKCTICHHSQREAIERAILAGVPIRIISDQYGISLGAINRHKEGHMVETLAKARDNQMIVEESRGTDLLAVTMNLLQESQDITSEARGAGDLKTALMGIGKTADIINLLVRVAAEMKAMQQEESKGEETTPYDFSLLSDDELLTMTRLMSKCEITQ
jgi:hypothetical protein